MKRRAFVQATAASACAVSTVLAADPAPRSADVYELRTYTLRSNKLPLLDSYLKNALLPALRRLGCGPTGVFAEVEGFERDVPADKKAATAPEKDATRVHVLVVHKLAETVLGLSSALATDGDYAKAGAEFLAAKAADPVCRRTESSLFKAFAGMPAIERPDASKPRLFNLRTYESHNDRAAAKKVEMFESGEIAIFKRVGLTPVFFASAIAGAALPNLTYLLVFPDDAARKAAWGRFGKDEAWAALVAKPGYADKEIVSRITNRILTPRPYSEI